MIYFDLHFGLDANEHASVPLIFTLVCLLQQISVTHDMRTHYSANG